jgi:prepilin-type processing-associated H-X9-DG protein
MNVNDRVRERAQDRRIAPALLRLVVAAMVVVLLPGCLFALLRAREQSRRAACLNNVKQLGLAMKQYSQDFEDTYPWLLGATNPQNAWLDLGMLYPNYCTSFRTFFCPSADDQPWDVKAIDRSDKNDKPLLPFASASNKEVTSYSYGMNGTKEKPLPWTESARFTVRLLADKKAGIKIDDESFRLFNHRKDGRNVLYQDGHVKWAVGGKPLDPDAEDDKIGKPDADDYKAFWSDPPFYGEGMKEEGADEAEAGENDE